MSELTSIFCYVLKILQSKLTFSYLLVLNWRRQEEYIYCARMQKSVRVRFMVSNVIFNNISVIYRGGQFIGGGNRSTRKKPTDLSHVTDILSFRQKYVMDKTGV
jgi:hypothetical protein